ncbi:MAG: hypothetical protein HY298_19965 [Verrucomicrobia bacterium]|nr:hypothetical protein [Verrucomicrobiota bacterium]
MNADRSRNLAERLECARFIAAFAWPLGERVESAERALSQIDTANGIKHLVNMNVVATQVGIGKMISP